MAIILIKKGGSLANSFSSTWTRIDPCLMAIVQWDEANGDRFRLCLAFTQTGDKDEIEFDKGPNEVEREILLGRR